MKRIFIILLLLLCVSSVSAQETLYNLENENAPVLNDDLRDQQRRIRRLQSYTSFIPSTGVIPLLNGGTGAALADPGEDKLFGWDDSASDSDFFTLGTGLSTTGTTLNVTKDFTKQTQATFTTASNSGDIIIVDGKKYIVFIRLMAVSTDLTLYLRFDSDSGATDYAWMNEEILLHTTPTESITGDESDSEIELGDVDDSDRSTYILFIENTDIDNIIWVTGYGNLIEAGGSYARRDVAGRYLGDGNVTSFELVPSTGTISGTVDYYEFN